MQKRRYSNSYYTSAKDEDSGARYQWFLVDEGGEGKDRVDLLHLQSIPKKEKKVGRRVTIMAVKAILNLIPWKMRNI